MHFLGTKPATAFGLEECAHKGRVAGIGRQGKNGLPANINVPEPSTINIKMRRID